MTTAVSVPPQAEVLDRTSEAVLRHLLSGSPETFSELMAICWKFTRPLFLTDLDGAIIVQGIPQFSDETGARIASTSRKEGSEYEATRRWIADWLLKFLASYRGKGDEELVTAAHAEEFRYLGRWCRQALGKKVGRRVRMLERVGRRIRIPLDQEVGDGEGGTIQDYIGTWRSDGPSSLGTIGLQEKLSCASSLLQIMKANAAEFARLDLISGILAYIANLEFFPEPDRVFDGRVTRTIAAIRNVSLPSARKYKIRFHETMRALYAGNSAISDFHRELITPPVWPQPVLFGDDSSDTEAKANRLLRREAADLMNEFKGDCVRDGISTYSAITPVLGCEVG